jgi:hypothetical protein
VNEAISDKLLLDDTIIEVDWQGNVVWSGAAATIFTSWASTMRAPRLQ